MAESRPSLPPDTFLSHQRLGEGGSTVALCGENKETRKAESEGFVRGEGTKRCAPQDRYASRYNWPNTKSRDFHGYKDCLGLVFSLEAVADDSCGPPASRVFGGF